MFEIIVAVHAGAEPAAVDLARCALINLGIAAETIVEERSGSGSRLSVYSTDRGAASDLARRLKALKLGGARVGMRVLKDENWQERWKKYFKPFMITPAIRVVPAWKQRGCPRRRDVVIDTTFAFGTGMHATTQLMARLIEIAAGSRESFLDIGTGSGILAIIAARCGFRRIVAIDSDRIAISTARANFALNGVEPLSAQNAGFEAFRCGGQFDFVAANLLTEDLVRMRQRLVRAVAPGGYLAVSGIFKDNYRSFRRRFRDTALVCVRAPQRGGWHAALFRKKEET